MYGGVGNIGVCKICEPQVIDGRLSSVCCGSSFFRMPGFNLFGRITVLVYLVILFLFFLLLRSMKPLRFEQIGVIFTTSILIPFSFFNPALYQRSVFPRRLVFCDAGVCGSMVCRCRRIFHRSLFSASMLAPKISPHKTVEGAVSGILFNVFFFLVMGICYAWYMEGSGHASDGTLSYYGACCSDRAYRNAW